MSLTAQTNSPRKYMTSARVPSTSDSVRRGLKRFQPRIGGKPTRGLMLILLPAWKRTNHSAPKTMKFSHSSQFFSEIVLTSTNWMFFSSTRSFLLGSCELSYYGSQDFIQISPSFIRTQVEKKNVRDIGKHPRSPDLIRILNSTFPIVTVASVCGVRALSFGTGVRQNASPAPRPLTGRFLTLHSNLSDVPLTTLH